MNIEFLNHTRKDLFIQVTNDTGLEIVLCNVGASIYSIKLDGEDMILSYKDLSYFTSNESKQGRFKGRIAHDEFIDGNKIPLSGMRWNYEISQQRQGIVISFYLKTRSNKKVGLGKCIYKVHYKIPKTSNNVIVEYEAVSKKECYFQFTNSLFFNLGLAEDISSHTLQLSALHYLDGSGTTKLATKASDLDLFEPRQIKDIKPLNHHFVYDTIDYSIPMMILQGELYKVEIYSDFDDLFLSDTYMVSKKELTNDSFETKDKGILFEATNLESEYKAKKQIYSHKVKFVFKRNFE